MQVKNIDESKKKEEIQKPVKIDFFKNVKTGVFEFANDL